MVRVQACIILSKGGITQGIKRYIVKKKKGREKQNPFLFVLEYRGVLQSRFSL